MINSERLCVMLIDKLLFSIIFLFHYLLYIESRQIGVYKAFESYLFIYKNSYSELINKLSYNILLKYLS